MAAGALRPLLAEVSADLITTLLVEFNWRPRTVGAFFVALHRRRDFEDLVGMPLLRSDVTDNPTRLSAVPPPPAR